MRHRKSGRKFGRKSSPRTAMFKSMVTSLLEHGQIRTTEAKAKELRGHAERIITMGKKAPSEAAIAGLSGDEAQRAQAQRVHLIRQASRVVNNPEVVRKVFGEYADRFANRPGGYTRVVKTGWRGGDDAPMAVIQLVEAELPVREPRDDASRSASSASEE